MRATALLFLLLWAAFGAPAHARAAADPCARPAAGSPVPEPADLSSLNGVLQLDLTVRDVREASGQVRYCYRLSDGTQAPTLRLHPGDELILRLRNALSNPGPLPGIDPAAHAHHPAHPGSPCSSAAMTATSTNLHFHGLTLPPLCHQDEVVKTSIQPGDAPFEYRFRIPQAEPPGLYWYHPHIHGFSSVEVAGGASGALIVEGLEGRSRPCAGCRSGCSSSATRTLVNPDAPPSKSEPVVPKCMIDRDGDAANNGTGFGKPAKDLSINYVPVPYPDYPPATIAIRPARSSCGAY